MLLHSYYIWKRTYIQIGKFTSIMKIGVALEDSRRIFMDYKCRWAYEFTNKILIASAQNLLRKHINIYLFIRKC